MLLYGFAGPKSFGAFEKRTLVSKGLNCYILRQKLLHLVLLVTVCGITPCGNVIKKTEKSMGCETIIIREAAPRPFKDGAYFCWCAHVLRITQTMVCARAGADIDAVNYFKSQ